MSDLFDSKYLDWSQAVNKLEMRQKFHDAVVAKYPPSHHLVIDVKRKLVEAQAEHDAAVAAL